VRFKEFLTEAVVSETSANPSTLIPAILKEVCRELDPGMPYDEAKTEKNREKLLDFFKVGSLNASQKKDPSGRLRPIKSLPIEIRPFNLHTITKWVKGKGYQTAKPSRKPTPEEKLKVLELQKKALRLFIDRANKAGFPVIGYNMGHGTDKQSLTSFYGISSLDIDHEVTLKNAREYGWIARLVLVFDAEAKTAKSQNDVIREIIVKLAALKELQPDFKYGRKAPERHWFTNIIWSEYGSSDKYGLFHSGGIRDKMPNPLVLFPNALSEVTKIQDAAKIDYDEERKLDLFKSMGANDHPRVKEIEATRDARMKALIDKANAAAAAIIKKDNVLVAKLLPKIKEVVASVESPYEVSVIVNKNISRSGGWMHNLGAPEVVWQGGTSLTKMVHGLTRQSGSARYARWSNIYNVLLDLDCVFITVGDRETPNDDRNKDGEDDA
jgi:hypothetical protein